MTGPRQEQDVPEKYMLPRNLSEQMRLVAQHYMFNQRQGWLLHPTIEHSLKGVDHVQIADVACGSGLWSLEMADSFPNFEVVGLDVSGAMFPPRAMWPQNCKFDEYDLLEHPPTHYEARFDIVHVRLLLSAGPKVPPETWIRNLRALLKPGGYLQWEEVVWPQAQRLCFDSSDHYTLEPWYLPGLQEFGSFKDKIEWFTDFVAPMRIAGFESIEKFDPPIKTYLSRLSNQLVQLVCLNSIQLVLGSGKAQDERQIDALRKDEVQCNIDLQNQSLLSHGYAVRIARRSR